MQIIIPTNEENAVLEELDGTYKNVSEMSNLERQFLNALLLRNKPKKLLEVGVSRGASSVIMLNAIKNDPEAQLYSVDLLETYYDDSKVKVGSMVDKYSDLKKKYHLFTGDLAYKFIDIIGGGIDFCLLDTVHTNPGEILDFLMIFPYLTEDATVVFHDVNLHTHIPENYVTEYEYTNNLLMSSIYGEKLVQGKFNRGGWPELPNIGAIKLNKETREHLFEIFNLLTLKWINIPSDEHLDGMKRHFSRFYDGFNIQYFNDIVDYHKRKPYREPMVPMSRLQEMQKQNVAAEATQVKSGSKKKTFWQKLTRLFWKKKIKNDKIIYRLLGMKVKKVALKGENC